MPNNNQERLEHEALESLVANELSAKMKHWRAQNQPPPRRNGKWFLRLLVMLLVCGGVAWLFWPSPQPRPAPAPAPVQAPEPIAKQETPVETPPPAPTRNYAALARQAYQTPDFANQIRGSRPDANVQVLQQAQKAIAARQYAEALSLLDQAPPEYQSDARYLRGHALFELRQYRQAAQQFEALQNSVRYGEAAVWYLQLAQLAADSLSVKRVQKNLQNIAGESGHAYQQEASKLLRALNALPAM
ncbi:MAG: hypothetical protein JNN28_02740 [Saprospiraceae bacterium]|nr:hypothetical protein [Saprospiraceae bacterium]